jgi:hypothetical protein
MLSFVEHIDIFALIHLDRLFGVMWSLLSIAKGLARCSTPSDTQKIPGKDIRIFKINTVDLGTLTLREQVLVAQDTASLVEHHGAGMTHVLFTPELSAVIKISSANVRPS